MPYQQPTLEELTAIFSTEDNTEVLFKLYAAKLPELINQSSNLSLNSEVTHLPTRQKRLTLIDDLEKIAKFIKEQQWDIEKKRNAYIGAILFGLESISLEYKWFLSPERSILHQIFKDVLTKNGTNGMPEDKERFVYLETFFHSVLYSNEFHTFVTDDDTTISDYDPNVLEQLRHNATNVIQALLLRLNKEVTSCVNTYPSENSINEKVSQLLPKYRETKAEKNKSSWGLFSTTENPDRIFAAQLVMATIASFKETDVLNKQELHLNFALKVKLGALIYYMKPIEVSYINSYLNKPVINYFYNSDRSELYKLGRDVLNIKQSLAEYPEKDQMACLAAFKCYLNSHLKVQEIALKATELFGNDSKLHHIVEDNVRIQQDLYNMINPYFDKHQIAWNALPIFAILGAYLLEPFPYGLGSMIGKELGDTNQTLDTKIWISKHLLTPFGKNFNCDQIGFLLSDAAVKEMLGRFFGKALEPIGIMIGGAAGGLLIGAPLDLAIYFTKLAINYFKIEGTRQSMSDVMTNDLDFANSIVRLFDEQSEVFAESQHPDIKRLKEELQTTTSSKQEVLQLNM